MNRLKLFTTLKRSFPWLISILCISICVTLYYQKSNEADDSTEVKEDSCSHTLYEECFGLKQGELARSMNIKSADELGKEGFLNSQDRKSVV